MPTGYTAGIIDGKIKTFQDFAKLCMKAFGACIHMRDEGLNKKYEPRTPSDYYIQALEEAKKELKKAETCTDAVLIAKRKKELNARKKHYLESIEEIKVARARLNDFLKKAIGFKAPTPEHEKFREFMIEQLQTTIKWDGDTEYEEEQLAQIETELNNIDVKKLRDTLIETARKNVEYNQQMYAEDVKNCNISNEWVKVLLESLN